MTKITIPGAYNITAEEYHADPCPQPSLSRKMAHILLEKSPMHAWTANPRLNPKFVPESKDTFDFGIAGHGAMLEGTKNVILVEADSWRTQEARQAREEARAAGKTAVLSEQWERVEEMVSVGRKQLKKIDSKIFNPDFGRPEITLAWRENGIWCRARLDWQPNAVGPSVAFDDYKTTNGSAHPDVWARTAYGMGADLQAGFYRRGIRAVLEIEQPQFRFVVQETTPPYALSVIALSPIALDMAERKVLAAIKLWRNCLQGDYWPGYPQRTCYIDPPGYEEARWLEREERERMEKLGEVPIGD